jgi:7-cyano-7-deazaguanine tRNA-ribosyltransferase
MDSGFEIKQREGLARIATFNTKNGKVMTPTLMPVLDPLRPEQLPINEIVSIGAEIFITNAYLCYRNDQAHKVAVEHGIHKLINFNGPVMTDSGAFQLMGYGTVEVSNEEITKFQEDIGVDIGVFLDIPVANGTYVETKEALNTTITRAKEHINLRTNKEVLWAGPIQGGKYLDLLSTSAKIMGDLPFQIYAIGSVVPLLENYEYLTITKMILTAKKNLPLNRPVHLFGAGHPMIFALSVYLGIDLFDSAAYWLFAKAGRYMTSTGSFNLSDLEYFPCGCSYCSSTTPETVKKLNKSEQILFLARHNLSASFIELRIIRQAIKDGRLWNLVLQRSTAHPNLALAVQHLNSSEVILFLEKFSSLSYKKSRLYSHVWSLSDPLVLRFKSRVLERFPILTKNCVIYTDKLPERFLSNSVQKIKLHPVFGLIPQEWMIIYPIMQHLSFVTEFSQQILDDSKQWIARYEKKFEKIFNTTEFEFEGTIQTTYNDLASLDINLKETLTSDRNQVLAMIKYQYNVVQNLLDELEDISVIRSKKSNRIKEFYIKKERWGTIRASDSMIIPGKPFAVWLHSVLSYPLFRVTINTEVKEFVLNGKSAFCKFCDAMDINLRPGDECLIVTHEDELLGWGQVQYTAVEVKTFTKGIVVKTRGGINQD